MLLAHNRDSVKVHSGTESWQIFNILFLFLELFCFFFQNWFQISHLNEGTHFFPLYCHLHASFENAFKPINNALCIDETCSHWLPEEPKGTIYRQSKKLRAYRKCCSLEWFELPICSLSRKGVFSHSCVAPQIRLPIIGGWLCVSCQLYVWWLHSSRWKAVLRRMFPTQLLP